jgi:hypothetical protein
VYRLAFIVQPTDAERHEVIRPAIRVALRDEDGNPRVSFTGSVTIALGANSARGKLKGTFTKRAVAGIATFDDLEIDRAGRYTLVASATGYPTVTSAAFDIQEEDDD